MQIKILLLSAGLLAGVFGSLFFGPGSPKVAYVDCNQLYQDFQLTKELDNRATQVQNQRKNLLDSLKLSLETKARQLKGQTPSENAIRNIQIQEQHYLQKEQEFTQSNQNMLKQYNQQIWNQLNQYIEEYGKQNGYDFIYGANGSGNIMYANAKNYDLTNEVTAFANNKYQGAIQ